MLATVEAVVKALGGTTEAARLVGAAGPSAVSNWLERGEIPADKFLLISEALRAEGKEVDPRVFAFKAVRRRQ